MTIKSLIVGYLYPAEYELAASNQRVNVISNSDVNHEQTL